MKRRVGKKKADNEIFESIRKPIAPPSKIFGQNKPDEKALPSLRKVKHKKEADNNVITEKDD
jgi:hypothetical protein